jgi:hypothetical protein
VDRQALAPYVGARLSGLIATYPVFATAPAAFSHRGRGPAAAIQGCPLWLMPQG